MEAERYEAGLRERDMISHGRTVAEAQGNRMVELLIRMTVDRCQKNSASKVSRLGSARCEVDEVRSTAENTEGCFKRGQALIRQRPDNANFRGHQRGKGQSRLGWIAWK